MLKCLGLLLQPVSVERLFIAAAIDCNFVINLSRYCMTVITAVQKGNEIAIACDTQTTSSDLRYKITADYRANSNKLLTYGDSIIGHSGSNAIKQILESLFYEEGDAPALASRDEIFQWLLSIQPKLKETYLIKASGDSKNQPVESNQVSIALVANPHGIFSLNGYREVNQFLKFWAIGSGQHFALGAMQAVYDRELSAAQVAEAGVLAATEFCPYSAKPVHVKMVQRAQVSEDGSASRTMSKKTAAKAAPAKRTTAKKTAAKKTTSKKTTVKKNSTKQTTRKRASR